MILNLGLAVDALSPALTGIGRYCWELVSRVPGQPEIESATYWRGNDRILHPERLLRGNRSSLTPRARFRRWGLRRIRSAGLIGDSALWPRRHGVQLFHGPNFMLPPWVESGVITVHDLSVFLLPETHPAARIQAFEHSFRDSLERARRIITPSQTIRRELAEFAGIAPDLISVVPMGVSRAFAPVYHEDRRAILARLGLPEGGYALTLATLEPRKRIDRLLDAWRILPEGLRLRFPLAIAGASGWENAALQERIGEAVAEGWAIALGYVDDADLPALYSGAHAFIYPSMYEGFGMPPIEAMACGVPVAVANCSCLPEISSGAAALINPEDPESTAASLAEVLTDEVWRASAVERGFEVAASYSWERCISETVAVYSLAAGL
ncbi:MAG: glycosyltransferase family 1 protein [Sphingomonadaceae bacterium]|nr:glycosyltransferase family 1 protein [Sphingomonadaceae bacterium]